ncbi:acyltransferase [Candidatus Thioglobus sp.]|nr:acyltransferase [Candidatus Thioglobus sp.]MDC3316059.1 acyltransferase [Candidatus Thioglobus sp.]
MKNITYRPDIDALRGLSILLVVIFHVFPNIIPGGFIGVDVFFVISGYLITSIILTSIEKENFSIKDFYSRRIRRLFPALIIVLSVVLLVGWLVLFPDELKQLGEHIEYSAIYVLNYILIGEIGYFDVDTQYKPLVHLWTLAVEEQYYIFWPILLLLIVKQKIITPVFFVALVLIASFLANIYYISNYQETVYFHTLTRAWQLASGSILAMMMIHKENPERRWVALFGLFLILLSAIFLTEGSIYPGWLALFPTIGAMLFIAGNIRFSHWGGMHGIGLISYPLYLWHWVVISFVTIYLGGNTNVVVMVGAVIFSLLLAWMTYKYIEPVRYSKHALTTTGLFVLLILVGFLGLYANNKDGIPGRGHLDYLEKFSIEFTRTPAVDDLCDQFVKSKLNEERLFDYCRSNNLKAEKYIAVIGDSHAHGSYSGISKIANDNGYGTILLANSLCPTLIGFEWGKNEKEIVLCRRKITQIMSVIKNDNKIDKVFIATRGPFYIHGEVGGRFSNESVNNSLSQTTNDRQTYSSFSKGLRILFKELKVLDHIDYIYYFLENPELDFLPKETVARPFDSWGLSSQERNMNKELYLKRMGKYRLIVKQVAGSSNITVIDPISYLCDEGKCFSYKNGNFLYADADHFSVFGSNYVAEKMKDTLFF